MYNRVRPSKTINNGGEMLNSPFSIFDMMEDIVVNEFTELSARKFRDQVVKMARIDPERPIVIYIDSFGGEVDALASMVETLHSVPNKIITVALGKAMSAGAMLLSMGDYRFCGENSRIMIHEISAGVIGNVHSMHNDVNEIQRLNSYWYDKVAKRCGLKDYQELRKLIKERDSHDYYMTPAEAKKFGLIDSIGTPIIQPITIYSIANSNPNDPIKPPTDDRKGMLQQDSTQCDCPDCCCETKEPKKNKKKLKKQP